MSDLTTSQRSAAIPASSTPVIKRVYSISVHVVPTLLIDLPQLKVCHQLIMVDLENNCPFPLCSWFLHTWNHIRSAVSLLWTTCASFGVSSSQPALLSRPVIVFLLLCVVSVFPIDLFVEIWYSEWSCKTTEIMLVLIERKEYIHGLLQVYLSTLNRWLFLHVCNILMQ